jgi:hypothetical protein
VTTGSSYAFLPGTGYETLANNTGGLGKVAFNASGMTATISSTSNFGLVSAKFSSALRNNLQLTIQAFDAVGTPLTPVQATLLPSQVTSLALSLYGVRTVTFSTSGGTTAFPGMIDGVQFAMDNLVLGNPVTAPEPASVAMTAIGLIGLGAVARRRRRRYATNGSATSR